MPAGPEKDPKYENLRMRIPEVFLWEILVFALLGCQVGFDLAEDLVGVQAVYHAGFLEGFVHGRGAANAVHAGLHQDHCDAAIIAKHFAHGGLLGNFHILSSIICPENGPELCFYAIIIPFFRIYARVWPN